MIGSPDLLAFTGTEGFGEGQQDQEGLPEELSVPLFPPANPWTCAAQFHRDFILVAEFSEQVGPRPLLTVPDVPGLVGSFDLNHFSVRIMSVDYQASGPCQAPPASPGPRLNFSEDSKVVLGDSAEDAFAYVHHVTLYDLEARGMVRPFCMAYVCSDQRKLMENFSELSASFSRASDSLKTGNRQAFSMELQRRLQELEYTRSALLQEAEPPMAADGSSEEGVKSDELEAAERSIRHHRDLLRQVTCYPNRKLKQPDFLPYDPADSLTDPLASPPPERGPSPSPASCRSERRLKPLEELCHDYFLTLMKEQLGDAERRLRGDRGALRTAGVTRSLSRRTALVNFLFDPRSPEDEEEEESGEAEMQTVATGKSGAEAEPRILESFCSCVEEISIKLEAGEAGAATPDPDGAAEMTGSASSGDSIEVLGTEKSYRTQHAVAGSDSREAPGGMTDTSCRRAAADPGVRTVRTYARRANSEDSIEVLSTTESIFPDDLTAITEEEAELQPLSNGFEEEEEEEEETRGGCESDNVLKEEETSATSVNEEENKEPVQEDGGHVGGEETSKQITVRGQVIGKKGKAVECWKMSKLLQVEEAVEPRPRWSVQALPDLRVHFPAVLAEADRWSPPGAPLRLLSVDEGSDCTSVAGSSDPPSLARPDQRRRRKAGLRALRFLKQNSFSQHAVFCLLSGRPLVVIGGDESLVRKLVDALSLFLPAPGPNGAAVMMCLSSPLQLGDLLTWRLIGIHRSSSRSSSSIVLSLTRYSRYLALLDLDQRSLRCPSYCGSLVGRLADPHTAISRGRTFLLHLEGGLTALANRALLHAFRPAAALRPDAGGEGKDAPAPCSSEHDLRVMRFLCDLISRRHAGRGPPALRISYDSMQLHRNTYAA